MLESAEISIFNNSTPKKYNILKNCSTLFSNYPIHFFISNSIHRIPIRFEFYIRNMHSHISNSISNIYQNVEFFISQSISMNLHTSNSIFSISPYCVLSFSQHMPINLMKRFLNSSHRKRKLTEIMYHPCASLTRRKYARSSKVKRNVYSHEHCPFLTRNYSPASNLTPSLIATGWIDPFSVSRKKNPLKLFTRPWRRAGEQR